MAIPFKIFIQDKKTSLSISHSTLTDFPIYRRIQTRSGKK